MKKTNVYRKFCKRGLSTLVVISMILCYVTLPIVTNAAGVNLFPAGDFEAAVLPTYSHPASEVFLSTDSFQGTTGDQSCKVVQTGGWGGAGFSVNLVPGKTYQYSVWVRFDDASPGAQPFTIVCKRNGDYTTNVILAGIPGTKSWQQLHGIFTYVAAPTDTVEMYISADNPGNTFYIDNLEISEYPYAFLENQIVNGNFEDTASMNFTGGAADLIFDNTAGNVSSGSYSMKVHQLEQWGSIKSIVYPKPGSTFYVGVKAKALGAGVSNSLQFNLIYGGVDHVLPSSLTLISGDDYKLAKGIIKIPAGVNLPFYTRLVTFVNPSETAPTIDYMVDDLEFFEIPEFKLISSSPENNTLVSNYTTALLSFNNDVDQTLALDINNFKLNDSIVNIESVTMPDAKSCLVTYKTPLTINEQYTLSTSLKDIYGQSLTASIAFQTKEMGKPAIVSTTPQNKAYNIPINTEMTVNLDMNIDQTTIASGNIRVNGDTALIKEIVKVNATQFKIVFNTLSLATLYNVTLNNIASTEGGIMDEKTISFFTTSDEIVSFRDYDTETSPLVDVITNETIGALPKVTVERDTTTSVSGSGGSLKVNANTNCAWVGFAPNLEVGKTYEFSYYGKTSLRYTDIQPWIHDAGGNFYSIPNGTLGGLVIGAPGFTKKTVKFKLNNALVKVYIYGEPAGVEGDKGVFYLDELKFTKIGSTVLLPFSSPAKNAVNVPTNTKITLLFNNGIDKTSLAGNIKINGSTALVGSINTFVEDPNKVEVVLASELDSNTTYEVTADNIKDSDGNITSGIKTSFTTIPKYQIGNFKLYKNYGVDGVSPIELTGTMLQSGNVTAVLSNVYNNSNSTGDIALLVVLYKGNNMVKAQYKTATITANGTLVDPIISTMAVPDLTNGDYYLKSFVWEKMSNAQPINDSLKITE